MANRVWAHFRPASEPLTPRITRQCSKKKRDRKSTRLNSSHLVISYAVFCFKKSTRLNSSHLVISYAVFCLKKKIKGCTLLAPRLIYPRALHAKLDERCRQGTRQPPEPAPQP